LHLARLLFHQREYGRDCVQIQIGRDLTEDELAAKPLHMRQPRECVAHPLTYRLQVTINGATRLERTLSPAGARGDRPLYVQHDMRLAPGVYPIRVDFLPLVPGTMLQQAGGEPLGRHVTLQQPVSIVADHITLITLDPMRAEPVVIGPEP
jgi:hypothetical protein